MLISSLKHINERRNIETNKFLVYRAKYFDLLICDDQATNLTKHVRRITYIQHIIFCLLHHLKTVTWLHHLPFLHLSFCLIRPARHRGRLVSLLVSCKMWPTETWGCPISSSFSLLRLTNATLLLLLKAKKLLCPWTGSSLWMLCWQCYYVALNLLKPNDIYIYIYIYVVPQR